MLFQFDNKCDPLFDTNFYQITNELSPQYYIKTLLSYQKQKINYNIQNYKERQLNRSLKMNHLRQSSAIANLRQKESLKRHRSVADMSPKMDDLERHRSIAAKMRYVCPRKWTVYHVAVRLLPSITKSDFNREGITWHRQRESQQKSNCDVVLRCVISKKALEFYLAIQQSTQKKQHKIRQNKLVCTTVLFYSKLCRALIMPLKYTSKLGQN